MEITHPDPSYVKGFIGYLFSFQSHFVDVSVKDFSPVEGYSKQHHTFKFQQSDNEDEPRRIFIRRGSSINFNMKMRRMFNESEKLSFTLVFSLGKRPRESNNTLAAVQCQHNDGGFHSKQSADEWAGRILRANENGVLFEVFIPSSAIVGGYSLAIEYDDNLIHDVKEDVVVLFNPWNESKFLNIQKTF